MHWDGTETAYRTILESGRLNTYLAWHYLDAFDEMFDLACEAIGKTEAFNRTVTAFGSREEYFRFMARICNPDIYHIRNESSEALLFDAAYEALGAVETFRLTMNAYREKYGNEYLEIFNQVRAEPMSYFSYIFIEDGKPVSISPKTIEEYGIVAYQHALTRTLSWFCAVNGEDDTLSIARTAGVAVSKEFWGEFQSRKCSSSGGSSNLSSGSGAGGGYDGCSAGGGGG